MISNEQPARDVGWIDQSQVVTIEACADRAVRPPRRPRIAHLVALVLGLVAMVGIGLLSAPDARAQSNEIRAITAEDTDNDNVLDLAKDERLPATVELFVDGASTKTLVTTFTGIHPSTSHDSLGTADSGSSVVVCQEVPAGYRFVLAQINGVTQSPVDDPAAIGRPCVKAAVSTTNINVFFLNGQHVNINVSTLSDTDRNGLTNVSLDERVPAEVELFINEQPVNALTTSHTGIHGSVSTTDTLGIAVENDKVIVCAADIAGRTTVSINADPALDPDGLNRTCGIVIIAATDVTNAKLDFFVLYLPDAVVSINALTLVDTDRNGGVGLTIDHRIPADVELFINGQSVNSLTTSYTGIHGSILTSDTLGIAVEGDVVVICATDIPGHTIELISGLPTGDPNGLARTCGIRNINSLQVSNGKADLFVRYLPTGDRYNPLPPSRILDTRPGFDSAGNPADGPDTPVGAGTANIRSVAVADLPNAGIPASATAVAIHVTSVGPTANSFLTVWPSGPRPTAASKNYGITAGGPLGYAGLTNDLLIVPVGPNGTIQIYNDAGTVDLVIDVVGYFAPTGDLYNPLTPSRILDTRPGFPTTGNPIDGFDTPIGAGDANILTVTVADLARAFVPDDVTGVAIHVTSVGPTANSFLTVWPSGTRPTAASKNYGITAGGPFGYAGLTNDLLIVPVGPNGTIQIYNDAGTVDLVIDIVGYTIEG